MSFNPNHAFSMLEDRSVPLEVAHPDIQSSYMKYLEKPSPQSEKSIGETIGHIEGYAKEKPYDTLTRNIRNIGQRTGEAFQGTANIFTNLATMAPAALLNLLSGEGAFDEEGNLLPSESRGLPMGAGLPSTKDYREAEKKRTGIKYEPRNSAESYLQEGAIDLTELGLSYLGSQAIPFLRGTGNLITNAVLPTILGGGSKAIVKGLGGTEKEAELTKQSIMIATTLMGNSNAPRVARRAIEQATQEVPQNVMANSPAIRRVAHDIMNRDWFRTIRGPEKNRAMDFIEELHNRSVQGNLTVRDVIQYRKDLNMARQQMGAFRPFHEMTSGQRAVARRHLDEVDEVLNSAIEHYGRQNPQWLNNYRAANQAYAVTSGSQYLNDVIQKSPVLKNVRSDLTRTLFMGGATGATGLIGAALPIAGGTAATLGGIAVLNRVLRSPLLRRHYTQVLTQAAAGNQERLDAAILAFDKAAEKVGLKSNNQPKKGDIRNSSTKQ